MKPSTRSSRAFRLQNELTLLEEDWKRVHSPKIRNIIMHQIFMKQIALNQYDTKNLGHAAAKMDLDAATDPQARPQRVTGTNKTKAATTQKRR